ncbi:GntR family transcriptional regulator [Caldicellulosiruptor naganoensis]|uniref:GntR family transcriptional regulator n=1 Tax=Caldicellulosiruptor naganoensis TaxID=29324 RepID=A0ABY7BIW9_9FIRM|nr:GntR family transcriptional regulator [Caldicellulosiruptor naganoensis]WAM31506.1 GntR family transcriptional regulator [Caldicellulosiruptor naganoensis]
MNDVEKILPKYITIYKDLREWIENATLQHGEKIGTEEQLCKKYSVSRITIKKALDMLENDGIIYRMKGKGIFYRNVGRDTPRNKEKMLHMVVLF